MPFVPTYSSYSGTDLIQKNEKCSVLKDFLSKRRYCSYAAHNGVSDKDRTLVRCWPHRNKMLMQNFYYIKTSYMQVCGITYASMIMLLQTKLLQCELYKHIAHKSC